jgi:hypothetical protein
MSTGWREGAPAGGQLWLPLHEGTVMVTMDTVRAALGLNAERVLEKVESGRLRWVWDISLRRQSAGLGAGGSVRELRFWVCELVAPEWCHELAPQQTLALILGGRREHWRATEVMQWLLCSRAVVKRLVDADQLSGPKLGRARWISRESLAGFLERRLVSS